MSDVETPFDFQAELAELLGDDDDEDEPTPEPTPTQVKLDTRQQTDLDLINLAADQALLEAQAANEQASRVKTDKALARLRERREELTALRENPALGEDSAAAGAVSKRIQQLVVELDMGIERLEAAGPYVHLSDDNMGTFSIERIGQSSRYLFTEATGGIGEAARKLEDAEHDFHRTVADRLPDQLKGKDEWTVRDIANGLRENPGDAPLRVRDALERLNEAQDRVDGMSAEITRRRAEHQRAERITAEALDQAAAKASAIDERTRKAIVKDTNLSPEDRAVELGRLQVPMSERKRDKEQWNELLADARAEAAERSKETQLRQRLGSGVFLKGDPLMRYLADGDRMELAEYEDSNDGRRGFKARSPAEAAALRLLRGVEGLPEPRDEAPIKNAQEQLLEHLAENKQYNAKKEQAFWESRGVKR